MQQNKQHLTMEYEFILRIFIAAVLGGLIGLEREWRATAAGFRTHFLVVLVSLALEPLYSVSQRILSVV